MQIHAPFFHTLLDYASYHNMDTRALRELTAKPDGDFTDPKEMMSASDYLSVFQRIIEERHDPYVGLNLGAYLSLASLGLVLEISLSTSSLKQGISFLDHYLKSKFPIITLSIVAASGGYALRLDSAVVNKVLKRHLLDMVLCIVYREMELMLATTHPAIGLPYFDQDSVNQFFRGELLNCNAHQVLLPQNFDDLKINVHRMKEIEVVLPKFISMLNENDRKTKSFAKRVKGMALHMCDPEIPGLKQVQRQFACSERTFQRRLTLEGTSFRSIANEIKAEMAKHLAAEKHLKTKDIAHILGYSESSAYLHAQNGWRKNH